jgi:hypothetical protein
MRRRLKFLCLLDTRMRRQNPPCGTLSSVGACHRTKEVVSLPDPGLEDLENIAITKRWAAAGK